MRGGCPTIRFILSFVDCSLLSWSLSGLEKRSFQRPEYATSHVQRGLSLSPVCCCYAMLCRLKARRCRFQDNGDDDETAPVVALDREDGDRSGQSPWCHNAEDETVEGKMKLNGHYRQSQVTKRWRRGESILRKIKPERRH